MCQIIIKLLSDIADAGLLLLGVAVRRYKSRKEGVKTSLHPPSLSLSEWMELSRPPSPL